MTALVIRYMLLGLILFAALVAGVGALLAAPMLSGKPIDEATFKAEQKLLSDSLARNLKPTSDQRESVRNIVEKSNINFFVALELAPAAEREALKRLEKTYSQVRNQAQRSTVRVLDNKQKVSNAVLFAFEASNLGRIGVEAERQHRIRLSSWYENAYSASDASLSDCVYWANQAAVSLGIWNGVLTASNQWSPPPSGVIERLEGIQADCANLPADAPKLISQIPAREAVDKSRGLFYWLTVWIIATDSLPLARILGALGFGLIGAFCNRLIRREVLFRQAEATGVFRKDTPVPPPGIAMDGLLAGLLVYLGVEAGVYVFGTEGSQANPYSLFLACMIGATFSERVWSWAEQRVSPSTKETKKPED